jgi:hypothetical protein
MKRMQPLIDRINGLEPKMKGLADADFPGLTADFARSSPRAARSTS